MMGTSEDYRAIAQRIKQRRAELNLSLQNLADMTDMSKSTLQRYEAGSIRNIPLQKLGILAQALQVSADWLLGWENALGERDLGLMVIDIAKWLNASPEMVDSVMEDMGWPDATNPEILCKISAEVERRKIMEKHSITWTRSLREKLQNVGCLLESTELILGASGEPNTKWIWFSDGTLELSDQELKELDYSTDSFLRFKLQELREKHKEAFKPHKPPQNE